MRNTDPRRPPRSREETYSAVLSGDNCPCSHCRVFTLECSCRLGACTVAKLSAEADGVRAEAEQSARRVETLQAERSRAFLVGIRAIDSGLRAAFRSLCRHGDCALE